MSTPQSSPESTPESPVEPSLEAPQEPASLDDRAAEGIAAEAGQLAVPGVSTEADLIDAGSSDPGSTEAGLQGSATETAPTSGVPRDQAREQLGWPAEQPQSRAPEQLGWPGEQDVTAGEATAVGDQPQDQTPDEGLTPAGEDEVRAIDLSVTSGEAGPGSEASPGTAASEANPADAEAPDQTPEQMLTPPGEDGAQATERAVTTSQATEANPADTEPQDQTPDHVLTPAEQDETQVTEPTVAASQDTGSASDPTQTTPADDQPQHQAAEQVATPAWQDEAQATEHTGTASEATESTPADAEPQDQTPDPVPVPVPVKAQSAEAVPADVTAVEDRPRDDAPEQTDPAPAKEHAPYAGQHTESTDARASTQPVVPHPTPGPVRPMAPPAPAPPPGTSAPVPATATPGSNFGSVAAASPLTEETAARDWGRVDEQGTVYVRTGNGERAVGQMPDATPEEALSFFARRYADLAFEVDLLERRVRAGALAPDEASGSVKQVSSSIRGAQAVGDLEGLIARLSALRSLIDQQRETRRVERSRKQDEAKGQKERIAEEAERLAQGNDWRNGANRLRQLLDEWKALPRLEKSADDALWRRFSTARTTYTRRRKTHFSEVNEKRDSARVIKEKLVVEAESLAQSTEWGPTAGRYRDLMRQWKAAGPAPKGVDDQLWKRFRAAQDTFFGARDATNAEQEREFAANAEKKEGLLAEAEALLPVTDLRAAKEAFRGIAERWDAAGKVPRERIKDLEARMRRVEQTIRGTEDDQWRRSNPEARARAANTVAQLESGLADLERQRAAAEASGNTRKAEEHAAAIQARQSWLTEARRALEEFSG